MPHFDPTQPQVSQAPQAAVAPATQTPATAPVPGTPAGQQTAAEPKFLTASTSDAQLQERKKGWIEVINEMMSNPNMQQVFLQMAGQVAQPLQQNESLFSRIAGAAGSGVGQFRALEEKAAAKSVAGRKAEIEAKTAASKELRAQGEFAIKEAQEARASGKSRPEIVTDKDGNPIRQVFITPQGELVDTEGKVTTIAEGEFLNVKPVKGTEVTVNIHGKQPLTKTTKSQQQKKLLEAEKSLQELDRVADSFKSDYLNIFGRAKAGVGGILDILGFTGDAESLIAFNANRGVFQQDVDTFFNQYRKEITGAAASIKELELLKDSLFSTSIGPAEFEARYNNFVEKLQDGIELHKSALREGIDVNSVQSLSDEELAQQILEAEQAQGNL